MATLLTLMLVGIAAGCSLVGLMAAYTYLEAEREIKRMRRDLIPIRRQVRRRSYSGR